MRTLKKLVFLTSKLVHTDGVHISHVETLQTYIISISFLLAYITLLPIKFDKLGTINKLVPDNTEDYSGGSNRKRSSELVIGQAAWSN